VTRGLTEWQWQSRCCCCRPPLTQDFGHMDIDITNDDPGAYAKPWTVTLPLLFQADTELLEYICNENNLYFEIVRKK